MGENGKNAILLVNNVESNATENVINDTKNVINDTISKSVTKSEKHSVSPEPTAHDFNLEFLKHLDDLKSEKVKNDEIQTASELLPDSEKLVQEDLSDSEKLVQVQNA